MDDHFKLYATCDENGKASAVLVLFELGDKISEKIKDTMTPSLKAFPA
ncbi:MAG: hypothetical protein GW903_04770 [Alphaproteobacteria bacterium]|nr:hypothetical protein [Alphaproteobacteria bacterium]NCQ88283.1 hypothetical protein [Alphaproteobacteria bacterium]NCT05210.1 hypothetical protein [Alphaproteobacteria bacterium]